MGWIQIFYLQKLGEFCVAEVLASLMAKVQPDEVTVPVEGNMMMHAGLAEDVTYILWKCEMLLITRVAEIISRCCLQNPPPPPTPPSDYIMCTYQKKCSPCRSCQTAERQLWTGHLGRREPTQRPKTPGMRSTCCDKVHPYHLPFTIKPLPIHKLGEHDILWA